MRISNKFETFFLPIFHHWDGWQMPQCFLGDMLVVYIDAVGDEKTQGLQILEMIKTVNLTKK